ncbi:DUF2490 domain-containing protein [Roseivirga sp. BDSF3-8]|uniref:DUF2490 domain-containing protein n=1 Tax=Roseivirga sp. BDSF3-8 TaxID=3241598 RepID=UPI003531CA6D
MKRPIYKFQLVLALLITCAGLQAQAQDSQPPEQSEYKEPVTRLWINTYGNFRLSKRLFWIAQTHFRFQEKGDTPFAGQIAQVYNRHAISYLLSKSFNMSVGGVLRVNFNTQDSPSGKRSVPEWRIWHEYQFAMPLERLMVYHRIRLEHRWSKGFAEGSEYIFRNRWRYMLTVKIPVNKPVLSPKTFYIAPEAELIMQSGEPVVDSPMEDLRLHTSFGYILTPRLTVAAGVMYSQGQELADGAFYNQKWTTRLHVYFAPDFRKVKNRLPSIHMND